MNDPLLRTTPLLRTVALAALARVLSDERREHAPLLVAREACRGGWSVDGPLPLVRALLAAPTEADRPLAVVAAAYALTPIEVLAIALAAAVEDDAALARALASLQAPVGGARPTLGLLDTAFADCDERRPSARIVGGAAEAAGLLRRLTPDAPLPEQALRVPLALALRLHGVPAAWPGLETVPATPLPQSWLAEAAARAQALGSDGVLAIRAHDRADSSAAAGAVAAACGRLPAVLSAEAAAQEGFGAWCLLARALPAVHLDPGPLDHLPLPRPVGLRGPLLVLLPPDGGLAAAEVPVWRLEPPPPDERRGLWAAAVPAAVATAAADPRLGPARIAALASAATARGRLAGRAEPDTGDIERALIESDQGLGGMATPVRERVADAALVLPAATRRDLDLLLLRCRGRDAPHLGLGPSLEARPAIGVRALLVGPPGTGKSLAVAWLATRLGLPLHRVDLSAIASKWIGETEKNLARLLAAAEAAETVLLFDEADALFAQRTEVRDASDRYANATTNYLLARLETFRGIVVLTANSRARFDAAFARRLDALIDVPAPGPEERRALWRSHLGDGHALGIAELNRLSAASDLAGGHIRNAVLAAALLARARGAPIAWADVVAGLTGEYRKVGRALPAELAPRG